MFEEARLKIERADEHITDFDTRLSEFFKVYGYVISIKNDPQTREDFVEITVKENIPARFGLILGDAIHNLRSALDLAWFEMAGSDCPKPERESFPIHLREKDLISFIKGRPQHHSLIRLSTLLLNQIQPYKDGNGDILWRLHKLDAQDKHRILLPQVQIGIAQGLWVEDEHGEKHGITRKDFLATKPFILRKKGSKTLKLDKKGQITATIVFGKGTAMPGHVIVPTLRKFEVAVNCVLEVLG